MGSDDQNPIDEPPERPSLKVEDRRHWARRMTEDEENSDLPEAEPEPAPSGSGVTAIDAFRSRAEAAEAKLHDYIGAFRQSQTDAEAFRERVTRDMERKVELKFADLVRELLGSVDDLELALAHVTRTPEAEPLARGVALALQGFLQTLERHGVTRITPDGEPFDPEVAEAVRVDPVDDPDQDGVVTQTMRPGYRLGEQLVRPAAVAVGRRTPS